MAQRRREEYEQKVLFDINWNAASRIKPLKYEHVLPADVQFFFANMAKAAITSPELLLCGKYFSCVCSRGMVVIKLFVFQKILFSLLVNDWSFLAISHKFLS